MLSIEGRVRLEAIEFDQDGDVKNFTRKVKGSIRRLGGITTSRRPVETYIKHQGRSDRERVRARRVRV